MMCQYIFAKDTGGFFMAIIGERLKTLRSERKPTQKEIAEAVHITEVSYQRYEYGTVRPSLDTLIALADYFDVSLDYLVGRSNNPKRSD
jgi:transcriptional regulator with XRE-family HTH domain